MRIIAVLVLTLLGLAASMLAVPARWQAGFEVEIAGVESDGPVWLGTIQYQWVWDARVDHPQLPAHGNATNDTIPPIRRIYWPVVVAEQIAIVLLGGGLLSWAVRRERRRRAAAG